MMLGLSMVSFAFITRVFAYNFELLPNKSRMFSLFKYFNLELGLSAGLALIIIGLVIIFRAISLSNSPGFETIGFATSVRYVYGACLSIVAGGQIIFTSFVLSMLGLNPK